jgi:hypothetical protein
MIPKAQALIAKLDVEEATILVPAPLITELFMATTPDERALMLTILHERCLPSELDMASAIEAANIWNKKAEQIEALRKEHEGLPGFRSKIKIDTMILGIAVTKKANILYTEDVPLTKLAHGYIRAEKVPEIPPPAPPTPLVVPSSPVAIAPAPPPGTLIMGDLFNQSQDSRDIEL